MIKLGNKSSFEEAEYYYELIELETENDALLVTDLFCGHRISLFNRQVGTGRQINL